MGPDHHDNWKSTAGVIKLLQTRQPFWGADPSRGWPDPDFVYTGGQGCNSTDPGPAHGNPGPNPPGVRCPGQTDDEYVSEYSVWAIAGGQMILAADPRNMTDLQRRVLLNDEVIAVFKDVSGFGQVRMVGDGGAEDGQVWVRPLADGGAAVVLHNGDGGRSATLAVSFAQVPGRRWSAGTKLAVRDLWARKDLGAHTGTVSAAVPPHGAVMLKLA